MRLSDHKRLIAYHDLRVTSHPDNAPKISGREIATCIEQAFKAGKALKEQRDGSMVLRIHRLVRDNKNDILTMLFQLVDDRMSDPVFGHKKTGKLRHEAKQDDEGMAYSAHMMISLVPDESGAYLSLLEVVPCITIGKIASLVRACLGGTFDKKFSDGGAKTKKYSPKIEFLAHPSDKLKEAVESGYLRGVELVKTTAKVPAVDEQSLTYESKQVISLDITNFGRARTPLGFIKKALQAGKKAGFSEMRVRLKADRGSIKTVVTSTATLAKDIEALSVVRMEEIEVARRLINCESEFVNVISREIRKLFDEALKGDN